MMTLTREESTAMTMRRRRPPLTLADVTKPGPPIRLRDLVAITGLSGQTIREDIARGELEARQRIAKPNSTYLVDREAALRWLVRMGFRIARSTTI